MSVSPIFNHGCLKQGFHIEDGRSSITSYFPPDAIPMFDPSFTFPYFAQHLYGTSLCYYMIILNSTEFTLFFSSEPDVDPVLMAIGDRDENSFRKVIVMTKKVLVPIGYSLTLL